MVPVHKRECAPERVDELLSVCQQCQPPLSLPDRGSVLADSTLPGAQASLFHQESDAHPLWKRSQKRKESIVHDQRHRETRVSLEQAPEMAVAVEPNSPGKRCTPSAHH